MDAFQQLFIAGLVLAAFGSALWALQKRGLIRFGGGIRPSRAGRKLELLERLQISPQHSLCLIRLENRTLLIGTAPASCNVLHAEPSN